MCGGSGAAQGSYMGDPSTPCRCGVRTEGVRVDELLAWMRRDDPAQRGLLADDIERELRRG